MKTKFILLAAFCGCGIFLQPSVKAEEGGSGHYLPGAMASFADSVPLKEAFVARYNLINYSGSVSVNQPLPIIAGVRTLGADATIWGHGLTFLWRPPIELGDRWSYALSATVPFMLADVSANVTVGPNTVRRTSSPMVSATLS